MNRFKAYLKTIWSKILREERPAPKRTHDVVNPSIRESRYLNPQLFEAIAMPVTRLNGAHPQYHLDLHKTPNKRALLLGKPLPPTPKLSDLTQNSPQWRLPLAIITTHPRAARVLKKRYEDKFALSFDVKKYPGLNVGGLDNGVMSQEDLEKRVLGDITWIRDRYRYANLGEPTDRDIIWWYDAENYDVEDEGAEEDGREGDIETRKQFLGGLMYGNFQYSKSTPY